MSSLLEEEKIKMVSITDDNLCRQQAFKLDIYNFHQCPHTALINLLIEANHARLVAETTANHWRQRCEEEHRKLDLNSAGERLYKYNLPSKTESPGEVNRPVFQRQLEVVENSCEKD